MVGLFFKRKSKSDHEATGPLPDFEATAPALYDPRLADFEDTTPDALPGMPDLYAVIGVDERASDDTIRYAYRRRAAKLLDARWRPGRAARRLAELNAAYEILGKPDRRADYDRQRMRQAAYERARLAAVRADPFEATAYRAAEPVADVPANGFETGEAAPESAFRASEAEPTATYRDGVFHDGPTLDSRNGPIVVPHDGPTLVGSDGATTIAASVRPAPTPPSRSVPLPRLSQRRDVLMLVIAALLAVAVVAGLVGLARSWDASSAGLLGQGIGLNPLRSAPTATVPPAPTPTPRPVLVQQPVVPTSTPVQPTATLPARPTVAPKPNAAPGPGAVGTQVRITDQNPPRRSDVGVTVRVTRDGRPLAGVPVALRVYYSTIEERWPPGEDTVSTNASGEATVVFNVGDATPGYEAQVVAVADVGGEPFEMQTSFVPR